MKESEIMKPINILLIEDSSADAKLIEVYLRSSLQHQFTLTRVDLVSEALQILKKEAFDVIISDLSLPDSLGLETFKQIRSVNSLIPIIVLTGNDDEKLGLGAMKSGAQDFLVKGKLNAVDLTKSIRFSIERSKLLNELAEKSKVLDQKTIDLELKQMKLAEAQRLAHIGSWELDVGTGVVSWSDELYKIFGISSDEFEFKFEKFFEFIHPEDCEETFLEIKKSLDVNIGYDLHFRIIRPDGSVRMLHSKSEVVLSESGELLKILGTNQDVTDRFREEELEKLVLAATQSVNAVIITDRNGRVEWVNKGFTDLSGYELDDVKDTMGEIIRKNKRSDEELKERINMVLLEKKPLTYENKNYTKTGEEYWSITSITPVIGSDGEVERLIFIDSDITDRKAMEIELQQANKIAEHSLMKGNKALNELIEAKKQLEESLVVKEQFLANMSHEIRTPMNAIIGFTNLILQEELSNENKQFLHAIKTSSENLLVIINDILDFTKIQSGKVVFENINFNLREQIVDLNELIGQKASEKGIELIVDVEEGIPEVMNGDPTRLNQILLNLLSNAVKFTEKGYVKLEIKQLSSSDDKHKLRFSVHDTGIGIASENISKIFQSFTQGSNDTTRKYGGTGLGLTICKQLVEGLGGEIEVKSELTKGSEFSFVITFGSEIISKINELVPSTSSCGQERLKDIKVLLVEDNQLNQILAKKILTNWDCQVIVADNGKIALDKLRNEYFDIVLMDVQMPEMDGYETTLFIRSDKTTSFHDVPIIAMTAHAIKGEASRCLEIGMDDYISKPFAPTDLFNKISAFTNKEKMT